MTGKDLLKLLIKNGWQVKCINGSHHKMVKGNQTLIVPIHGTDLKPGTLHSILKRAGLK